MSFIAKGILGIFRYLTSEPIPNSDPLITVKITLAPIGTISLTISTSQTLHDLKRLAIEKFRENDKFQCYSIDSEFSENMMKRFKLIRSCNQRILTSASSWKTLVELQIEDGEEFVMMSGRANKPIVDPACNFTPNCRITLDQINQATVKVEPLNSDHTIAYPIVDMLFQDDMRKIFVTLAQESAYVIGLSCHANKLIEYYREKIHNLIASETNAIAVMTQLGFEHKSVVHAMDVAAGNYRKALDWLIENESQAEPESVAGSRRTSVVKSSRRNSILSSKFKAPDNVPERVDALLEIVHFYADTDEVVFPDVLLSMLEMGYSVETARAALKVTRNCTASAVAFIAGERSPSIFEIRQGVSPSSEIRKSMLESAEILAALGNPQMFEFLVNILHNPSQARQWERNSDIGRLMTHIITTYHNVKHSMAINQFNQNSQLCVSAITAPNTL